MKITCDSCGSKYTIADAKVKGRKVKVRCKGCKESILVDGTQLDGTEEGDADDAGSSPSNDAESPEAVEEAPKKDKNLWSVNLTDDDSRDMTLDELVAGWKSGLVTSDAYVWKDGMGDWKPILEVGELKLKLGAGPKKAGGGVVSSAGAVAAPAAAKAHDKMDDLFGGVDLAGDEPSEVEKPVGGGAVEAKPTGARNDSSVLFSLDSLNAAGGDEKKNKPEVDIFGNLGGGGAMLTNNADLLTAPAKAPPAAPAGARTAAPTTAAPSKGKGGLIAAILIGAAVIGGVLFFVMSSDSGDEAAPEDPAALAAKEAEAKKAEEERKKAEDERAKLAAELKQMQDELKKARDEATEKGEDPEEAAAKKQAELEKEKEAEAKAAAEKSGSSSTSSGSSSKSNTSSSKPSPSPTPAPKPSGGAAFDVGAARAALSAAAANAAGCKQPGGPTGSGKVQVTFSSSGRVTSATVVSGPFGGTAVGGCVASTFRRARVPAFSGDSQTVAKSFRIP